ncbi:DDE superfamily endonuclease [Popillia japonica]|uniref:DDE superfamily endonuclease n=1 Tax=Popillia japonica TaxID=7064 RepID=A0AAW1IXL8_POPJA
MLSIPDDYFPGSQIKTLYVIVADDAFRLIVSERLMKPWGQQSTKEEKIFNYRLSRAPKMGQQSTKEEKIFNYRLSRAPKIVENAFAQRLCFAQLHQT